MAEMKTLHDLFLKDLRDVYSAEKQITKALPKMAKAAGSEELRTAFQTHLEETHGQIERLDRAFEILEGKPGRGVFCKGMAGLIEEGNEMIAEDGEEAVLDAGIIASAQKVEHYEICAYGTLSTWAEQLGQDDVAELLKQNLAEEKATDEKLTRLAESGLNQAAEAGMESADEEEEAAPPARMARSRGTSGGRGGSSLAGRGGRTSAGSRRR